MNVSDRCRKLCRRNPIGMAIESRRYPTEAYRRGDDCPRAVTIERERNRRLQRSIDVKPLLIPIGLILAVLSVQGVRRDWRVSATTAIKDCRTDEILDDGCTMFWSCLARDPV